jgi:putative FmdB family regulatory protein
MLCWPSATFANHAGDQMPLYTYRCQACDSVFETLVRSSDVPACPSCASTVLERQIASISPDAKIPGAIGRVRAQAAREGHLSNYARSERPKR